MRSALLTALTLFSAPLPADDWPQFRGPRGSGLAPDDRALPAEVGPTVNVRWKVPLPPGHSSPVVVGDRVYVTAVRERALVTIALDRRSGRTLWEVKAPHQQLEKVHRIGSHTQSSPAADADGVVCFFGSCGLFAYDRGGQQVWHRPMGPFKNEFGAGSSPILAGDRVLLGQDHDTDSFLMALDRKTGKTIWQADRSEFPRGYATPVLWDNAGKQQVVMAGPHRLTGYDLQTGNDAWTVYGRSRIANRAPVVGADGNLYVPAWAPGADPNDRIVVPAWDELMKKQDADGNGTMEEKEAPAGPLKERFPLIDRDKDGHITKAEYQNMRRIFETARNSVMAIKPGGAGDITKTHVLWSYNKHLPYVPSPVYYKGHLYMVKNGGIVTCLDAKTGQLVKQGRVAGSSNYYSSPVIGDGKIYLLSERGDLAVLSATPDWKVLHTAKFDEDAFATPAIAGGQLFVRTAKYLYCLGAAE